MRGSSFLLKKCRKKFLSALVFEFGQRFAGSGSSPLKVLSILSIKVNPNHPLNLMF